MNMAPASTKACGHPIYVECIHEQPFEPKTELEAEQRRREPTEGIEGASGPCCPIGHEGADGSTGYPGTLLKEDRLEAEATQLRIMLLIERKKNFLAESMKKLEEDYDIPMLKLREQVTELQKSLSVKYGIDFTKQQIEPGTGRIISAGPQE